MREDLPDDPAVIRAGGKGALARALAALETDPDGDRATRLLSACHRAPQGHVLGITGPPGVGKSTLINALITGWRSRGKTVGVIAVDPSSRRSGGALLGDRTRFDTDPEDRGIFVRSMAARDHLGGLAGLTVGAMVLMRALYDRVIIETVGVGQSETEVVRVADTVLFCVQPGSGDSLQFMKAGIAEIPHVVAVTKADMEKQARRAVSDVEGALGLAETEGNWPVRVVLVSALRRSGLDELVAVIEEHAAHLSGGQGTLLAETRLRQAETWLADAVRERFGREGIRRAGSLRLEPDESPFARLAALSKVLLDPAALTKG